MDVLNTNLESFFVKISLLFFSRRKATQVYDIKKTEKLIAMNSEFL